MKSTYFSLANPNFRAEPVGSGLERRWVTYRVPILPAYAILNHSIEGISPQYHGQSSSTGSDIDGDELRIYGLDDLGLQLASGSPVLLVSYLGIRNYQAFFPEIETPSLRQRASQYLEEADRAFEGASWLSFVLMAGAVFESFLVDLTGDGDKPLGPMIEAVRDREFFDNVELKALDDAKAARNLVHPGRHDEPYITRDAAMNVRVALEQFLRKDWSALKTAHAAGKSGCAA